MPNGLFTSNVPSPVNILMPTTHMTEGSLQDDSRLTQLTGLFMACVFLPKEKQPALLSDVPSSLDYCKQTAYALSFPLRTSELTEQPAPKEVSDRLIMNFAEKKGSFAQRVLTESAKHITQ